MTIFCICVKCECIALSVNGKHGVYGFYKNEYVRAFDTSAAAETAKMKVRDALQRNPTVTDKDAQSAILEIDEIEEGLDETALSNEEGFVFFKSERPDC